MSTLDNSPRGSVTIPDGFSDDVSIDGNQARQLLIPSQVVEIDLDENDTQLFETRGHRSERIRRSARAADRSLLVPRTVSIEDGSDLGADPKVRWSNLGAPQEPSDVCESLARTFEFVEASDDNDQRGLRVPQIGALHSILGYWSTDPREPATIVMPTGTGKTETMLAVFAHSCPERLLVVVPSDALRNQIAEKFERLGVLQGFGLVPEDASRPVVGRLRHAFATEQSAREFASRCNVVVATPNALNASQQSIRETFTSEFTVLFVDEAHHVAADTWRRVKDSFSGKRVVQFTATPFREDGRHLGGKLLYAFPLREAQRQGYFSIINYVSVVEFEDPDVRIAQEAIRHLRADLKAGYDHILMARVRRIGRASELAAVYRTLAPEFSPVVVHSTSPVGERQTAIAALRARESRILVCVDMFGEGFDLPELKIAAIHDPHKTLGVTLQFVGRFARSGPTSIGDATVVVGRPEMEYDENIRRLYSEDADWNVIIRDLTEGAVAQEQETSDFEETFSNLPDDLNLHSLLPKMSAAIYRVETDDWDPSAAAALFPEESILTWPIPINQRDRVAWFVVERKEDVRWGDIRTLEDVTYELFVMYWDEERHLLFLNSSNTSSFYEDLVKAVVGETASRIRGETVYRAMAGIQRLVPTNVGVIDIRNRARRFSMYAGADVSEGFPRSEAATKTKTNIFAYGYENGTRVSVGASLKGRIWSYRVAHSVKDWMDWCNYVGQKVVDETISVDGVMESFIRPEVLEARPDLVALSADWPFEVFLSTTEETRIKIGDASWPLVDTELEITSFESSGPIEFAVVTDNGRADYAACFEEQSVRYEARGTQGQLITPRRSVPLDEFFRQYGLTFHLEQDATIVHPGLLLRPQRDLDPFDREKIQVVDWTGVDLHKESRGPNGDADSIQQRSLEHLLSQRDWEIVVDDDGTGEIADLVALMADEEYLDVGLVHCKYAHGDAPGSRVADLYELCGQAQKSVRWRRKVDHMFRQLIRRERNRAQRFGRTGFIRGDGAALHHLHDRARLLQPRFSIVLAQPGLSQGAASEATLDLLASTELYVMETALAQLVVYASA